MSLFIMIYRNVVKNIWLYACLLSGLIISVALVSSIPIYTEGMLNKMLIREMQQDQLRTGRFPGSYSIWFSWDENELTRDFRRRDTEGIRFLDDEKVLERYRQIQEMFSELDAYSVEQAITAHKLPLLAYHVSYSTAMLGIRPLEEEYQRAGRDYIRIQSKSDLSRHIRLIDGRFPANQAVNGVYEAMVTQNVLMDHGLFVGQTYVLYDDRYGGFEDVKIRLVGVFTLNDPEDPYWIDGSPESRFADSFVIDEELMINEFIGNSPTRVKSANYAFHIDYHELTIDLLRQILRIHSTNARELGRISPYIDFDIPGMRVFRDFFEQERELETLLTALYVPLFIMLFLYTLMLCKLITSSEQNELAVLGSRGISASQVIIIYLIKGVALCLIALLTGPPLGYALSRLLGSTAGFMEFVQRRGIVTDIGIDAYQNAVLVLLPFMIMLIIAAKSAGSKSIVSHKRMLSGRGGSMWQKWYPDVLMLSVAAYGYYQFDLRRLAVEEIGHPAARLMIDPLLFLVAPLSIAGAFLFFLRIYPWLMRAVFMIGKYIWKPDAYITLIQLARYNARYHFIMLFLAMTVAVGIFGATSARTINQNYKDRIWYNIGADMVITPLWLSDAPAQAPDLRFRAPTDEPADGIEGIRRVRYTEPPFEPFTRLSGVEHAAKVFNRERTELTTADDFKIRNVELMGIEPYSFGNTVWWRYDLLPHHINEYLNLLSFSPGSVLISETLAENGNVNVGESIRISWPGTREVTFTVVGIVEYWPTFNPIADTLHEQQPMLVIGNLPYIQTHLGLEPYRIWLRLKPEATTREVYEDIARKELKISHIHNTREDIIQARRSPFLMAINGALTLGFLLAVVVSIAGSILFWLLEMRSRVLQLGILRAVGMKLGTLLRMFMLEQILTSGVAIIFGLAIGFAASALFVPFFQTGLDAVFAVPPFRVLVNPEDINSIFASLAVALSAILGLLGLNLFTLRINQALKLGED